MGAKLRANPAVLANDRLLRVFVEENSVRNACALAASAADAFIRIQQDSAAVTL